ncbi:hypothetical protein [Shimazuella kribbensis]|uniref:hypothetical protein n=1 Tax=Shimazuella kribbensis TaxID=139808 RepID=UPI0003FA36FC|nr:hypothetical protein [Shimazuella kribbensis]
MKLNQIRILQASGIGAVIMFALSYIFDLFFSLFQVQMEPNTAIIVLTLPPVIIGQIVIGYWIGKHVDKQLFLHVFLANTLIVIMNYLYTYFAYGMLLKSPGSSLVVTVILTWPTAIWVSKRRLKRGWR